MARNRAKFWSIFRTPTSKFPGRERFPVNREVMTDLDTIGPRLRAARESKGMTIEDAAFETRIHAHYLRGLENDDYSGFASATYAKSFLSLYSRYLGVDARDALQFFENGSERRLSSSAILPTLSSATASAASPRTTARRDTAPAAPVRRESPGLAPLLLGLVVVALVVGIPVLWYLGKDAQSIDEVTSKAKAIAEATRQEIGTQAAVPPTAEPSAPVVAAEAPAASQPEKEEGEPSLANKPVAADWVLDAAKPRPSTAASAVAPAEKPADSAPKIAAVTTPAKSATPIPTGHNTEPEPAKPPQASPLRAVPSDSTELSEEPQPEPAPASSDAPSAVTATEPAPAAADLPPGMTPAAASQTTPPAPPTATPATPTPQPLRATPLIAVPIAIPTEPAPADNPEDPETKPESDPDEPEDPPVAQPTKGAKGKAKQESFVDPRNRFPRPLEE